MGRPSPASTTRPMDDHRIAYLTKAAQVGKNGNGVNDTDVRYDRRHRTKPAANLPWFAAVSVFRVEKKLNKVLAIRFGFGYACFREHRKTEKRKRTAQRASGYKTYPCCGGGPSTRKDAGREMRYLARAVHRKRAATLCGESGAMSAVDSDSTGSGKEAA